MNLESISHAIADIALGSPITPTGGPLPEGLDLGHPAWEPLIRTPWSCPSAPRPCRHGPLPPLTC